ncbi:hypothetical protein BSL78_00167 [Apostichopus japonicus]|uniref:Uncharacterized protein n=1 Tax=Stichopus japonicus TaxID=307972 RepID=A0A2G8LRU3_STIJA|nr:hypothetical protein BSL78_00167 [Apostichopus japonicus]
MYYSSAYNITLKLPKQTRRVTNEQVCIRSLSLIVGFSQYNDMAMSRDDSDASGGVFNHPLFPAGGNSRAGSFEEPFGRKQRETRGVNQPFWSVMTQRLVLLYRLRAVTM